MQKTLQGKSLEQVLSVLRKENNIPMSKIAAETNLSIPTVKKVLDFCVANGKVSISDSALATGGRKAQLFSINSQAAYRLFVVIDASTAYYRCLDFSANVCKNEQKLINTADVVNETVNIFNTVKNEFENIELCSLCVPAVVKNGKVMSWPGNDSLNSVDLAAQLEEKCGVKTAVYGNLATSALAYGDNAASVQYNGSSVAIAQVINGAPVIGKGAMAGNTAYFSEGVVLNFSKYFSKVINALCVITAPEKIIFYGAKKDGFVDKVMKDALKKVPSELQPEWVESGNLIEDIFKGLSK